MGGYTPGDFGSWIQFGFWTEKGRGARTYLFRTRNPQSFAHCVAAGGHDLQVCFAGAEGGELIRRDGSGTVAVDVARTLERYGCSAEECAPALLVFSGTLAECQSNRGVLGNLLRQAGIHSGEVGQALGRQDAHHAGLTGPREQRDDVSSFASEGRELVDDDEARSGS